MLPGFRIYQNRLRKGYTQAELSRLSGIPQPNLSNIEKGKSDFTVSSLMRIASALEMKPSELIDEENKESRPLTRRRIEAIAEAVIHPKKKTDPDTRRWADLLRDLLPGAKTSKKSAQRLNASWLELKKTFSEQELRGLRQRIEDAAQRK